MKNPHGLLRGMAFITGLVCTSVATATTGYFALGYGAKSMGLAGAVVSNPQDSIAAASNPAGMALVGERVDLGLRFFSPIREAEMTTSAIGAGGNFGTPFDVDSKSRRNLFLIPNLGYTKKINDDLYWGISIYGNGGMNTTYDRNLYDQTAAVLGNPLGPASTPAGATPGTPQTGTLGVDLAQALFAPTISMKVNEKNTVGVSLLLGVQRFSARGLGNFQCFTQTGFLMNGAGAAGTACAPGGAQALTPGFIPSTTLTDNGSDWSYGAGIRVGWIGEVTSNLTLGAAVASKVYMTEFDDYKELFAEDGDFDIPANFTVGVTFKASPQVNVSFDYQRILYEGVNSISNPGPIPTALGPAPPPGGSLLGTSNGMGFGGEDINIYRVAGEYMYDSHWTFRAGIAINDQPIPDSEVLFNILAPATIEKHVTVGFTYKPDTSSEWNFAYMHAFEESVNTAQSPFSAVGTFDLPASIKMYQNSVDLSYSLLF